ncbi:MAG: Ig-like domain-containing protein [Gemmatimonadales bacterium]
MTLNRAGILAAVVAVGLTNVNCSDSGNGGTAPTPVATTLALVSGDAQTATAGAALANPITVKVTDQNGAVMANVSVAFAVTAGGGSVAAASVTTNAQGEAATTWTLGPMAGVGSHTATASVSGLTGSPVTFTASATAGSATQIGASAGNAQTGEVGAAVAQAPTVTVQDANNNPVAGATVTWTVMGGGGSVSAGTSMTDAAGEASIGWTLGPLVGADLQMLRASLAGGANVMFTATAALTAGTLAINGGDNQSAVAGTAVATMPSVLVKTPGASGVPVQGVTVDWAVTAGGGTPSAASSVTDASGIASVGWTLGATPGSNNQGLSASSAGLTGSPVAFVASATAPPTQMALVSGDGQTGTAGQALAQPFVVVVEDAANAPVAGVVVNWQVTAGGGSVAAATAVTDAAGEASMTLTVGTAAGTGNQTVTAAVAGLTNSPITFTASVVAGAASKIALSSGNAQTAVVGTALSNPLAVLVSDQYDNPVAGATVNWAAGAGSGATAVASSMTNASGIATSGWTIGTVAGTGNQSATATAAGLAGSPVNFTASATAGPAATLAISSGDNQSAVAGSPLPAGLVVLVTDAYTNPVSGVTVNWAAATGGGSVSAPTSVTSATGLATVSWTLGGTIGGQTATASVAGTTPASVTFNATATAVVSNYNVTLRYLTALSPSRQAVFEAAATRWSTIITGDLTDVNAAGVPAASCGDNSPALNEVIDDILIFVTLDSIDGPSNILGSAGPCYIRSGTKLSLIGQMKFDTADVANLETAGLFQATILHEMGHVIGIGTLWKQAPSLLVGDQTADPYFSGTTAIAQFNANGGGVYGGIPVPVEATGGPGTAYGHWRESVMGKELMTGYISLIANPLSTITVGSLADAGYTTSYANADPYTVNGTNLRAGDAGGLRLVEGAPDWTLKAIDARGRITRVR